MATIERETFRVVSADEIDWTGYDSVPMAQVVRHAESNGSHFFDRDTLRFFRSRLARTAHRISLESKRAHLDGREIGAPYNRAHIGNLFVFVTSEKHENLYCGISEPRFWTARTALELRGPDDYRAWTMGQVPGTDFQSFSDPRAARRAVNQYWREMLDAHRLADLVNGALHHGQGLRGPGY